MKTLILQLHVIRAQMTPLFCYGSDATVANLKCKCNYIATVLRPTPQIECNHGPFQLSSEEDAHSNNRSLVNDGLQVKPMYINVSNYS
uniref:Putative secreted protein n=1 Tax=Anopheles darlingi TaxID=43151 RepID=A0A2M4DB07_ANODA